MIFGNILYNSSQLVRDFALFASPKFTEKDYPDLTGKVYIVTGASSGIGTLVAKHLCGKNAKVYMYGRTESRLNAAIESIKAEFPNASVEGVLVDYADLSTLKPAVNKFLEKETRLDGIVHNAGMNFAKEGAKSAQGIDFTLAVNSIAPYLFQRYLDSILESTAEQSEPNSVRIVWVASSAHFLAPSHGGIDWNDIENTPNGVFKFAKYSQSKAIIVYESILWGLKHPDSKVISVSVHPGLIKSDITRDLKHSVSSALQVFCHETKYGAYTELYPLLSPQVTTADTGGYFVPFDHKTAIRSDVKEGAYGEGGEKLYAYLEEQIRPFV